MSKNIPGRITYSPPPPEPWVDRVQEAREFGATDERRALRLVCDVRITRRKYYHMIADQRGNVIHQERLFGDALDWLDQQGVKEYLIETDGRTWRVAMAPAGK